MASTAAVVAAATLAGGAWADDQFTLDAKPDSFGPVVTDAAGNGYVTWEHEATGGGADVPMFCKLAPGTTKCGEPISLTLPDPQDGAEASALAPFAILGPASTVWVVASRYVMDDTLVWTSTDGGATFGPPHQIPWVTTCPDGSQTCATQSYSYSNKSGVDDVLPVTPSYQTYGGQTYLSGGVPSVSWLVGAHNPGLGFSLDNTAETVGGPAGASEFEFSNPGSGGVGGATFATTTSGDVVAAYWLITSPATVAFYTYDAPNANPISPQTGWSGPTTIGAGDAPRLADGSAGLFLLSADSKTASADATLIDMRQYNAASHTFGAPHTLGSFPATAGTLFSGGGLGENYLDGELAVAWLNFNELGGSMTVYLSRDGGSHYTAAQPVAKIGGGYGDADNTRVAIGPKGTGWVTFVDDSGLQVADLYALGGEYRKLKVKDGAVQIPVTCPAPSGACNASATLARGSNLFAKAEGNVPAATTTTLAAELNSTDKALLKKSHGKLTETLTLRIQAPGAPAHTTTVKASVVS